MRANFKVFSVVKHEAELCLQGMAFGDFFCTVVFCLPNI